MHFLYEDNALIVVEKAAGIPVESRRLGQPDLISMLKNDLAQKSPGKVPYLGVVHRLDQPVQGVMVFAKTKQAAGALSAQLTDGTMRKIYLAVVNGLPPEGSVVLTDFLKKDGRTNLSSIVPQKTAGAKEARLSFTRLAALPSENLSLIQVQLFTGRHHQIRVQLAHAGFPLYGDRKYNAAVPVPAGEPLALCAAKLTFCHPVSKKQLTFTCHPKSAVFEKFSIQE